MFVHRIVPASCNPLGYTSSLLSTFLKREKIPQSYNIAPHNLSDVRLQQQLPKLKSAALMGSSSVRFVPVVTQARQHFTTNKIFIREWLLLRYFDLFGYGVS